MNSLAVAADQFTGRTHDDLVGIAAAWDVDVPADATAGELRQQLRIYREQRRAVGDPSGIGYAPPRLHTPEPADDREARVDAEVRAVLADGGGWTVREIRAATMRSGEDVRASLTRLGVRCDGTGCYRMTSELARLEHRQGPDRG